MHITGIFYTINGNLHILVPFIEVLRENVIYRHSNEFNYTLSEKMSIIFTCGEADGKLPAAKITFCMRLYIEHKRQAQTADEAYFLEVITKI